MVTEVSAVPRAALSRLVRGRRSIRYFRDDPVPSDLVDALLHDVQWAPSPHNSQPWRFTVLTDPAGKARLADDMAAQLTAELRADGLDQQSIEQQTERSRSRIVGAPVVLLCSLTAEGLVRYPDERRNQLEWQMAVQSVGAALQTLFLLAGTEGLGACWMAAPMYCPDVVRAALDLPENYHPQALVLLGYPAKDGWVRPRRPYEEVVDRR